MSQNLPVLHLQLEHLCRHLESAVSTFLVRLLLMKALIPLQIITARSFLPRTRVPLFCSLGSHSVANIQDSFGLSAIYTCLSLFRPTAFINRLRWIFSKFLQKEGRAYHEV